jgi:putative flavoprotein involved in K+ transport
VWATGFTPDWSYVRLPIFDGSGYPMNRRGVTSVPGAFVLGLPWLWTWGSGCFLSVGRDAESVVGHWVQALGMVSAA